jgi:hypothetical protein
MNAVFDLLLTSASLLVLFYAVLEFSFWHFIKRKHKIETLFTIVYIKEPAH